MKTEIKIALIGGAVTLIAAVLPVVLGWHGPSSNQKEVPVQVAASGVQSASNSVSASLEPASSKLAEFAAIIRNRDLMAAKVSPEFRKLVKAHYGKEIEQLDRRERVSFWVEMARSLARQRKMEEQAGK